MRVRLKPADPFDLIRLLARSQNDPRKAVAELVQNSLDAGAREVTVTRYRKSGAVCLAVHDNGEGVLPEMDRPGALQHLATHIGHSYKRHLTPEERYKLLQLGKYGIGLLGFWSVGRFLSMRSRVKGSDVYVLNLEEDKAEGTVSPDRGQKSLEPTWTEVTLRDVHPAAQRLLSGRRLSEYLAFELRGQLLRRDVRLRVVDKLARGRARQDFPVRPPRFQGVPLREIREWPVPGQAPIHVELHYLPEEHGTGRVTLACAGATVADDLTALEAGDFRCGPWGSGRLTGILDAPFLDVAPGTRRGIVPNEKAELFLAAVRALGERVAAWLAKFSEARAREADQALRARLRQVFRDLSRKLPQYELFPVEKGDGHPGPGDALAGVPESGEDPAAAEERDSGASPELYPPGPLEAVKIVPGSFRLAVGSEKAFEARATDATGRRLRDGVEFAWRLEDGPGALAPQGRKAAYRADAAGKVRLVVEARQGRRCATGEAAGEVLEELEATGREEIGIPEPVEVKDATGRWRSRVREGKWEFNGSHPDYLMVAADPPRRFRYLAMLLAKELVIRQVAGGPEQDRLLESLVEILTAIEDRLGRPQRKPSPDRSAAGPGGVPEGESPASP
jgi:hypothetical protein